MHSRMRNAIVAAIACAGLMMATAGQPAGEPRDDKAELLEQLSENVRAHDLALRATEALYEAGQVSASELSWARIARADAEALIGEVTGDREVRRAAQQLRIELGERLLREMDLKAAESSTEDRLRIHREVAEARVRLWRLDRGE